MIEHKPKHKQSDDIHILHQEFMVSIRLVTGFNVCRISPLGLSKGEEQGELSPVESRDSSYLIRTTLSLGSSGQ